MGKGCLVPLFRFHSQKPTRKRRFSSVSPVTIPALTTIVDRQFREDRTLCLVRALRYYLDRTKDLRGSPSLLFISFEKGLTSDIRPATLSSYLNKLSYFQSMTLGPSRPLRPFTVGYRWTKAHTLFYLNDLTWSNNNMYLGPVVAAQQVLVPSPWHTHLQEEKKGGTPTAAKSSGVYSKVQVLFTSPDVYSKVSYIFYCIMYLVFTSVP